MLNKRGITIKIVPVLILCFFILGCSLNLRNKYGLDKENPTAVEIWHYYNGVQKIEFDKMVEEFNKTVGKKEGIIVEAFSQGSINELTDKVIDTSNEKIGAGKMPEAFTAYPDTAYKLEQLGLLSDYNQYLSKSEMSNYIDNYIEEGKITSNDKLTIFPIAKSTEVLMVNKTDWDMFAKETNADINKFQTWEGIAELAKQYYEWSDSKTEIKDDGKAFFGRDAMANYMMVGSKELGEEIFKIEDGKVNVNLNEKVMRKLWDNFYVPYINGYYGAYGRFRSDDTKTGDIIAFVGSTPGAEYFPSSVIKNDETSYPIDCMVLPIPKFENYKGYMPEQGAGIVLTKSDRKHEYAVTEFLKWFTDVERNTEFSIKSGYLPVKKDANNIDFIKSKIAKNNDLDISQKLQDAIFTSIDQENSNEFYFVKAFNGSNKARDILEKAMLDKAKLDRDEIQKQLNNGISKKELINKYDTDENFKKWFEKLKNDINNAM